MNGKAVEPAGLGASGAGDGSSAGLSAEWQTLNRVESGVRVASDAPRIESYHRVLAPMCRSMPSGADSPPTEGPERVDSGAVDGGGGGNRTRVPESSDTERLRV